MILHYLSLAWQQLEKYRLQSLVSIVSLGIGFACFALASMWIKYETTYDAFHKDADRMCFLMNYGGNTKQLITDKIEQFPEVEETTDIIHKYASMINGKEITTTEFVCESNFVSFFGVKILEGDNSFLSSPTQVAVTKELAEKLWGDESPIGQLLIIEDATDPIRRSRTVAAVVKGWGEHSNFAFDMVSVFPEEEKNDEFGDHFFLLHPTANIDSVNARLDRTPIPYIDYRGNLHTRESSEELAQQQLDLVRMDKVRQANKYYESRIPIKLNHIYLFAIAGGVLILCGLLNYLTMFINRLFIRQREMALRTVFGATGRDLIVQFLVEYGLLLVLALVFGFFAFGGSLEWFRALAVLPEDTDYIYREALLYMVIVMVVSMLVSLPFIWYFRRQSLHSAVLGVGALSRYNLFRRISTGAQLGIAMCCIFCVVVLMKQLHTLRQGDLGFTRENIGFVIMPKVIHPDDEKNAIFEFLKQQPEVDTLFYTHNIVFPENATIKRLSPDIFPKLTEPLEVHNYWVNEGFCNFYGLQLLEGRWLNEESDQNSILVNETLVQRMGWRNPIGETLNGSYVVGVVKDIKNSMPTTPVSPCYFGHSSYYYQFNRLPSGGFRLPDYIVFNYHSGTWVKLKAKLDNFCEKGDGNLSATVNSSCYEEYEKMLKSEKNLQKLLHITTIVCILIALFGVWSMIMLTCEQRRKEIAVRKVFGATTKDILDMFIVEYMALQGVAALVAFPIGYACMKPWLEQYVVQTSIPWWIYVGIFVAVALLVALCVGWRVWKTAKAHPADEIAKGRG